LPVQGRNVTKLDACLVGIVAPDNRPLRAHRLLALRQRELSCDQCAFGQDFFGPECTYQIGVIGKAGKSLHGEKHSELGGQQLFSHGSSFWRVADLDDVEVNCEKKLLVEVIGSTFSWLGQFY
jgi:hypothetical protein